MRTQAYRALSLGMVFILTLAWPASVGAEQPTVNVLVLADGTACRGPITGTTFSVVDQHANYACTDGRWVMGQPFGLGDGRQVALLAHTILAGQRASDDADPCQQATCITSLEHAEVATWASLPPRLALGGGSNRIRGSRVCTFVDGQTFFVGTARANYQCDPSYWRNLKDARQDEEYWILGGPMPLDDGPGSQTVIFATVVRQNTPLMNVPTPVCERPVCVLYIQELPVSA
jgi:hypothetical protein